MSTARRFAAVLLSAFLSLAAMPSLAEEPIRVILDGKPLVSDVPPKMVDDRVLVPLRSVTEALGAIVSWDPANQRIIVERGVTAAVLKVGSTLALVNGEEVTLSVPPLIENGRTMVPVRFVSEALGDAVKWDPETRTVTVTRKPLEPDVVSALLGPADLPFPASVWSSEADGKALQRTFMPESGYGAVATVVMSPLDGVPQYAVERTPCEPGETEWLRPEIGDAARVCYKEATHGVWVKLTVAWGDRVFMVNIYDVAGDKDFAYELARHLARHQGVVVANLGQGLPRPPLPELPARLAAELAKRKAAAGAGQQETSTTGGSGTPAAEPAVKEEIAAPIRARLQRLSPTTTPAEFTFGPIGGLKDATAGQNYAVSLCDPAVDDFSDLCGWPTALNPRGGRSPYFFYAKGFPAIGLKLLGNGFLTGRPAAEATGKSYPFEVCAQDLRGIEICQRAAVRVLAAQEPSQALQFSIDGELPWARVGQPYRYAFRLAGGIPPYTFRTGGAGLPAGLALSADGVISGTPAAGTSTNRITVCAVDGAQTEICREVRLEINQNTDAPLLANTTWKGNFTAQDQRTKTVLSGSLSFHIGKVVADTTLLATENAQVTFATPFPQGEGFIYCLGDKAKCTEIDIRFGNSDLAFQVQLSDPILAKGTVSPTLIQGTTLYQGTYAGSFTVTKQ